MPPASISCGRAGGGRALSLCEQRPQSGLQPRAPKGMNTISDLAHLNKRSPPARPPHSPVLSEWPGSGGLRVPI